MRGPITHRPMHPPAPILGPERPPADPAPDPADVTDPADVQPVQNHRLHGSGKMHQFTQQSTFAAPFAQPEWRLERRMEADTAWHGGMKGDFMNAEPLQTGMFDGITGIHITPEPTGCGQGQGIA